MEGAHAIVHHICFIDIEIGIHRHGVTHSNHTINVSLLGGKIVEEMEAEISLIQSPRSKPL